MSTANTPPPTADDNPPPTDAETSSTPQDPPQKQKKKRQKNKPSTSKADHHTNATGDSTVDDSLKDARGTTFDSARHAIDRHGNPRLTRAGNFRLKPTIKTPEQQEEFDLVNAAAVTADALNCTMFALSTAVGGDLWKVTKDERHNLNSALTNYLVVKNITDVPPGVLLLTAYTAYALPRFASLPDKRSKIRRFVDKFRRNTPPQTDPETPPQNSQENTKNEQDPPPNAP